VAGAYYQLEKVLSGHLLIKGQRPSTSFQYPEERLRAIPHWHEPHGVHHVDEALAYAAGNWGEELFVDAGKTSLAYALHDRTQLTKLRDDALFVAQVCAVLSVGLAEEDPAAIENSVLYVSHSPLSQLEIEELALQGSARYCSRCGHWLDLKRCPGCDWPFPAGLNLQFADHGVYRRPMPRGVIDAFRERGHLIDIDVERWLQPATS
jgi:hypothetical protein